MTEALPEPLPLDEAQARILELATPLGGEELPIADALGRYLAEDCVARRTQPPADLSAMDGYALKSADGSGPWRIIGESAAGHPFEGAVGSGEAIRISTGAYLPEGADSVLIQESTARDGATLNLTGDGPILGKNIRRKGFDFSDGDVVLSKGRLIEPAQIGLAFAAGHSSLNVGKLPTVAILDSGDELSSDPANCADGQIPASNGVMLQSMVSLLSGSVLRLGPVKDDREALAKALAQAEEADVLVTTGGASVGDHDLIRPALQDWGAELDFWRVKMKPGKPIMVARRGPQTILGLPGNPVSAYVGAFLFLLPLLRRLAGAELALPRLASAVLSGDLGATGTRLELTRGLWDGTNVAALMGQDSSGLSALGQSNALILREPYSEPAKIGETVQIYPLGEAEQA